MFALGTQLYLALQVEWSFHDVFSFVNIVIEFFLEYCTKFVELTVEVIAELQLLFLALVKF